jgi:hypothetical protein
MVAAVVVAAGCVGRMLYIADGVCACVCCGKKVGGWIAAGGGFICWEGAGGAAAAAAFA